MKRQVGNSIRMEWTILRNGQAEDFSLAQDIKIVAFIPHLSSDKIDVPISRLNNVFHIDIEGDLLSIGKYTLHLTYKVPNPAFESGFEMVSTAFKDAFQILTLGSLEDDSNITSNVIYCLDGATFIPTLTESATEVIISWTNNRGLPNPDPVNIRGTDGKSAFEIWKEFTGQPTATEQDFFDYLQEPAIVAADLATAAANLANSAASAANTAATNAQNVADTYATTLANKIDKTAVKQVTGTSTTDVMSQKAVTDELNKAAVYNITNAIPLSVGQYYTSTTARAAVPTVMRKLGLILTYETAAGVWYYERFIGANITNWTTAANWLLIPDKSYVDTQISNTLNVISENVLDLGRDINSLKANVFNKKTYRAQKIIQTTDGNIVNANSTETTGVTDFIEIPSWATKFYVYSREGNMLPSGLTARFSNDISDNGENDFFNISNITDSGRDISSVYNKYLVVTVVRNNAIGFIPNLDNIFVGFSPNYKTTQLSENIIPSVKKGYDLRFLSLDFQCFEMYKADRTDKTAGGIDISNVYKSFLSLRLIGFDTTKKYTLTLMRRKKTDNQYALIFGVLNGTEWSRSAYFTSSNVETNENGINIFEATLSDGRSIKAVIDYSFIPQDYSEFINGTENAEPNFIVKQSCFYPDPNFVTQDEFEKAIKETDLEYETGSNLANPANIQDNMLVASDGSLVASTGWSMIGVPVKEGDVITFGRINLGRAGYSAFYNGTEMILFNGDYDVSISPKTVTTPSGATMLYLDIKSPIAPDGGYDEMTINKGTVLLPYEPFQMELIKIKGYVIKADTTEIQKDVQALSEDVLELNVKIADVEANMRTKYESKNYTQMDLPQSDGSDIKTGYVYIETTTNNLKLK